MNLPDVFISYRWTEPDMTWVRNELVPSLEAAGINVCIDVEDFLPGRDLILEMEKAGVSSAHVLCVISKRYFEEDRFVWFESLLARKKDPGGQKSALIPIIIESTELPEWIRGLVPVDWTDVNNLEREWRKLLQVLSAPSYVQPPPLLSSQGPEDSTSNLKGRQDQLTLVSISPLAPRAGLGIGWDVALENKNNSPVTIGKIMITGIRSIRIAGYSPMHNRIKFEIVVKSGITEPHSDQTLNATVFDDIDSEWGRICSGQFTYVFSTAEGHETWSYAFTIPADFQLPPKQTTVTRLVFRYESKEIVEKEARGSTPALTKMGISTDEHKLSFYRDEDEICSIPIDISFLEFIANNNP